MFIRSPFAIQRTYLNRSNHDLCHFKHILTHISHPPINQLINPINHSHPKRLSVQSVPSQRRRSRTVLFPSGSVFALTILSSITQRDVIGVVPSLVFKLVLLMRRKMGSVTLKVIFNKGGLNPAPLI